MNKYSKLTLVYFVIKFSIISYYTILSPFTKVEESFNLQASHDLIKFGLDINKYDHLEFPGVVPRTFLGPIILTSLAKPVKFLLDKLNIAHNIFIYQYLVRLVLGLLNSISSTMLFSSILKLYGTKIGYWFMLFNLTQFHIWFWCSRTIPNSFSLILTTAAFSYYLSSYTELDCNKENTQGSPRNFQNFNKCFALMIISGIIFRSETLFLIGFYCIFELVRDRKFRNIRFIVSLIKLGIITMVICLAFAIPIDSFFWKQKFMWAEGQVFYFNAILGKSEEWGTMPFHSYFTRFLPRILHFTYLLSISGMFFNPADQLFLIPCIFYILFMSCLGHKEWRFIEYTFPLFSLSASITTKQYLIFRFQWINIKFIKHCFILAVLIFSIFLSSNLNYISQLNYPGGYALQRAHHIFNDLNNLKLHLDTYTAMTGASRFGELRNDWVYSKLENIKDSKVYLNYDVLLTNEVNKHSQEVFEIVECIKGFGKVKIKPISSYISNLKSDWKNNYEFIRTLLPYQIIQTDQVCILRKKPK